MKEKKLSNFHFFLEKLLPVQECNKFYSYFIKCTISVRTNRKQESAALVIVTPNIVWAGKAYVLTELLYFTNTLLFSFPPVIVYSSHRQLLRYGKDGPELYCLAQNNNILTNSLCKKMRLRALKSIQSFPIS
jgi:hypothetical protein